MKNVFAIAIHKVNVMSDITDINKAKCFQDFRQVWSKPGHYTHDGHGDWNGPFDTFELASDYAKNEYGQDVDIMRY